MELELVSFLVFLFCAVFLVRDSHQLLLLMVGLLLWSPLWLWSGLPNNAAVTLPLCGEG